MGGAGRSRRRSSFCCRTARDVVFGALRAARQHRRSMLFILFFFFRDGDDDGAARSRPRSRWSPKTQGRGCSEHLQARDAGRRLRHARHGRSSRAPCIGDRASGSPACRRRSSSASSRSSRRSFRSSARRSSGCRRRSTCWPRAWPGRRSSCSSWSAVVVGTRRQLPAAAAGLGHGAEIGTLTVFFGVLGGLGGVRVHRALPRAGDPRARPGADRVRRGGRRRPTAPALRAGRPELPDPVRHEDVRLVRLACRCGWRRRRAACRRA